MGQTLLFFLIALCVLAAAVVGVAALTALAPPVRIRNRLLQRLGLAKVRPEYRPRSGAGWRPSWGAVSTLMAALATILIAAVLIQSSGADKPVQDDGVVTGAATASSEQIWETGVAAGWDAATGLGVFVALLTGVMIVFVLRPTTVVGQVTTVAGTTVSTLFMFSVVRQLRIAPEFVFKACLDCAADGTGATQPVDPATFELTLQGRGAMMECPRDLRHRIGPFAEAEHEVMDVGTPPLATQVAGAVDALRTTAENRTLRAFVVIGSADATRLSEDARHRYESNADLAGRRAQAVVASLSPALGKARVGVPPTLVLGGDAGLVRWAEGPRETLSAREVRLCALWEIDGGG